MKDLNERKVAALLSGSVDSSVAVALLVEQGVRPDLWYIQIGPDRDTTAYTANGTPYYTEASMVMECRIMYVAPFDPKGFKSDVPNKMYRNFPAGIHTMYIGEVINAWKK